MVAIHQKNLLEPDFPFHLGFSDNLEFPPHWHEEIEIVYMVEGNMQVGHNNETYLLGPRDILLIGRGNVHHFISPVEYNQSVIIQFGLSLFGSFSSIIRDVQFVRPLLEYPKKSNTNIDCEAHGAIEEQILAMIQEHKEKKEGYQMALKARLLDLAVIMLRQVPMQSFSSRERNRQISRLKRLDRVFAYIDSNYDKKLTLEEVANIANYSPYHFTRFFKDTTGMTFNEYLNSVRVKKAEEYLLDVDMPVTEIAYMSGFNSIQTFNRVFKKSKGCTPTEYRKRRRR